LLKKGRWLRLWVSLLDVLRGVGGGDTGALARAPQAAYFSAPALKKRHQQPGKGSTDDSHRAGQFGYRVWRNHPG